MPQRSQPTARQARLGAELRKMREAAGMTAREAAAVLGTNPIQMSHMEAGRSGVSEERIRRLASQYACFDTAFIDALVTMANERDKGWWEEYRGTLAHGALDLAELEHHAVTMRTLQAAYVPGLLQTASYVRSVLGYGVPELSNRHLEALVAFRLHRCAVLDGDSPPAFEAVIHESVLRTRVGDRRVAREQLSFLLDRSERPNVTLRVIPFDADGFGGAGYSMLYVGGPVPKLDTVQLDAIHQSLWLDSESQLKRYGLLFEKALGLALTIAGSREFVRKVLQEL
jgi:transcriptional regulator with XRE-family HTH domain